MKVSLESRPDRRPVVNSGETANRIAPCCAYGHFATSHPDPDQTYP
jgi:hypothetical protein